MKTLPSLPLVRSNHLISNGDDLIPSSNYFSCAGQRHIHARRPNEDRGAIINENGLCVAVICDGAGSSSAGSDAAELVSRFLAAALSRRFDELYFCDGITARMTVSRLVTQCLKDHSLATGTPEQALACTILAAAMDAEGRCICFHLGDGIILQQDVDDPSLTVVSPPMNGLVPGSTYLTMNCDMVQFLRYYRWQSPRSRQLLLLSDGAAEHLVSRRSGAGWCFIPRIPARLDTLRAWLDSRRPEDDYTAAQLIQ